MVRLVWATVTTRLEWLQGAPPLQRRAPTPDGPLATLKTRGIVDETCDLSLA